MHLDRIVPKPDREKALSLCEAACKANEPRGCTCVAHERSMTGGNLPIAEKLRADLHHLCDEGSGSACARAFELGMGSSTREQHEELLAKALRLLNEGCASKDGAACFDRAMIKDNGRTSSLSGTQRRALFEQACDFGDWRGCATLADEELSAPNADREKAKRLLAKGCEKSGDACARLAKIIWPGPSDTSDADKARELTAKGCAMGSSEACIQVSSFAKDPSDGSRKPPLDEVIARERRAGCERGSAEDCEAYGEQLLAGEKPSAASWLEGESAFMRACSLGLTVGCGSAFRSRNIREKREELRRACYGGDGRACVFIARDAQTQEPPALEEAEKAYEWACLAGDSEGCGILVSMYDKGVVPEDMPRTMAFLEHGCALSAPAACFRLAERTLSGKGAPKDPARAASLLKQSCYDVGLGCAQLASGEVEALGRELFTQDCARGIAEGCEQLAQVLTDAKRDASQRDPSRAAKLRERACEGGLGASCAELARLYDQGDKQDIPRAVSLEERACDLAFTPACVRLARWYTDGTNVPKNEERAQQYKAKACNHGANDQCN